MMMKEKTGLAILETKPWVKLTDLIPSPTLAYISSLVQVLDV